MRTTLAPTVHCKIFPRLTPRKHALHGLGRTRPRRRPSINGRQNKTVKTRPSRQGRQDEAVIIRGDDLLIGADDEIRTHAGKAQRLTSVDALFHPCIYNPASEQSCQEHSTCLAVTPESKWSLSYRPESYLGTVPLCPEI